MNRSIPTLIATTAVLLAAAVPAAAAPLGAPVLVDRPTGFGALPFDGVSGASVGTHALSADGRFVVFTSSSDVLADGDEDTATSVFRLDRTTGSLVQVNTTASGGQPSPLSVSRDASISADGRYVEFTSSAANLVAGAPASGLYVKDVQAGTLELASRGTGAAGAATSNSDLGVISGDGRHVSFVANGPLDADNADGVAGRRDAYVRALDAGTTHMVSVTAAGAEAGGVTARPDIDFHGDAVVYVTSANNDPDDAFGDPDAYVRTGIGGAGEKTRFVSFTTGQTSSAATDARSVAVSGDGALVAWASTGNSPFMTTLLPSVAPARNIAPPRPGGQGGGFGIEPAFEPVTDGASPRRVSFRTLSALDPEDRNATVDLYAAEVAHPGDGNFVHLETSGKANAPVLAGASAADGSAVVFAAAASNLPGGDGVRAQVYLHAGANDVNVAQPRRAEPRTSAAGSAFVETLHAVSDDGRIVALGVEAPALGSPLEPPPTNAGFVGEAVVRDVVSGQTTLVSAAPDGTPGDAGSGRVTVDAAGDRVTFTSSASNLVPGIRPGGPSHAYMRDLMTGAMTLVDRTVAGAPLNQGVGDARISADGRHLVYTTQSDDAPGAPANDSNSHVYVVDLGTGNTVLADRATGDGAVANHSSFRIDIDGDGTEVAFVSSASNLGAGDPGTHRQVYVRDLEAKTTTWASIPEDANPQHADADNPSLSRSGNRVAFEQRDLQFGSGMSGTSQVFVRNVASGTTQLASLDEPGDTDAEASDPSLSADGSRLSFSARPDRTSLVGQAYLRDIAAGVTTLVSSNRDGAPGRSGAIATAISGNGACVSFMSTSDDLVSPGYGPDFTHAFLRAVSADCPVAAPAETGDGGGNGPGAGPNGPSGPTTTGPDETPPRISKAHLTNRRFAVGSGRTPASARTKRGTSFTFALSEAAGMTIAITRRADGRRSGGRCVAPRRGLERKCPRTIAVVKLTRAAAHAGANRVAFSGRVGRTALKPGTYQARLVARDRAGNRSGPVTLTFMVVRQVPRGRQ
jgi:Tol biopolymer transport system component